MPIIIRPRNVDGSYGQPQKVGQGLTDKEKMLQEENTKLKNKRNQYRLLSGHLLNRQPHHASPV